MTLGENDSIIKLLYISILLYILMKNTNNSVLRGGVPSLNFESSNIMSGEVGSIPISENNIAGSLFSVTSKYLKIFNDLKKKILLLLLVLFLLIVLLFLLYTLYKFWNNFNKDMFSIKSNDKIETLEKTTDLINILDTKIFKRKKKKNSKLIKKKQEKGEEKKVNKSEIQNIEDKNINLI